MLDTGLAGIGLSGAGATAPHSRGPKPKAALSRTSLTIVAVVALIVLAAGGAIAYLATRSSSSPKAKPAAHEVSVASRMRAIETSASNAQRDLIAAVRSVTGSGAGLGQVLNAAQALDSAVSQARTSAQALAPSSSAERADVNALNQLLSDQATLAAYLENTPSTAGRLGQEFIAPIPDKADAINSSAAELSRLVPGSAPPAIDDHAWTSLDTAAAYASRQAAVRTFLVKIENLLSQSASGRSQLGTALSQTEDHCANAFASWMNYLYSYYYEYPVGCPGYVPTDGNYDRAVSESGYASAARPAWPHK
jgi:uncharacterized protein (UPF0333 family)